MSPINDSAIVHDALEHDVHAVTIYQANYAQITRKIKVDLKAGRNAVVIRNLPYTLVSESVKAVCQEGIVFDIIHESIPLAPCSYKPISSEVENRRFAVEDELAILEEQSRVLDVVNKSLTLKETGADELLEYLDAYGNRQHDINEKKQKLHIQSEQLSDEISEAYTKNANKQNKTLQTNIKVTVVLLAETNCEAEITFIYLVSGVGWAPQYDVNAYIAKDFKTQSSIDVNYRATIRQCTNEDWTDAILSLSTIVPAVPSGNHIVSPYPSPTGMPQAYGSPIEPLYRAYSPQPEYIPESPYDPNNSVRSPSPAPCFPAPSPPLPRVMKTMVTPPGGYLPYNYNKSDSKVGVAGTTFTVPGLCTIQSSFTQSHTVHIAKSSYDSAQFYYFTQPSKNKDVYLQSDLENTTPYMFVKGEVRVSVNDDFVTMSTMDTVHPGEKFICSFGAQPDIEVTYHQRTSKFKTKRKHWFAPFITSVTFTQKISIKNLALTRIGNLVVRENIPIKHSWNSKIKLTIIEPAELSSQMTDASRCGSTTGFAKGKTSSSARWVEDDIKDASVAGYGTNNMRLMEWVCILDPKAEIDLIANWETKGPGM